MNTDIAAATTLKIARLEQRCFILQQEASVHEGEMDAMSNCLVTMLRMVLSFVGEVKAELAKPGPGSPQRQHSTSTSQEKHHDADAEVSTSYKSVADSIINDFTNATKDQRAEHAVVATGQVEATLRSLFPFLLRCVRSSVDLNSGVSVGSRICEEPLSPRSHSFSAQQEQRSNEPRQHNASPINQETTAAPVVGALGLLSDLQVRSILENIEYDRRVKTIMRCYHDLLQKFAHQARADQLAALQQLRQPQKHHHVSDVLATEDQLDTTLSPVMWHDDEHTTDQRGGSSQHYDQQQRTTLATTFTVASNEEYSIPPRLKREESAAALHQKSSQGISHQHQQPQQHQQQQPQYRSHNNSAIGGGDVNYDVDLPVASSVDVSLESIGATHHHIHHSTSTFHRHRLEPDNDNNDDDEDVSSLSGSSSNGAQDRDDTLLPSAATTQRPGARGSQQQLSPRRRARTELQHATNAHHRHGVAEDDDNEHRSASSASVSRRSVSASSSFIAGAPQQLLPLREVSFGFDVAEYQEVVQENPIMEIDTLRIITLHLGSPADRCRALRVGDRLIKIGAQAVSCLADMDSAAFAVSLQPPGTPVSVHFIRRKVPLIATFVPEPSTVHPPSRHLLRPADLITSSARAVGSSPMRLPVRRDLLGTYQLSSPSPPRQNGGGHSSPPTNQNNNSSSTFVRTTSPARIHTISFSSPAAASTTMAQQDRVHSAELYARDRGTLDAVMDTSRQHVLYHSGSMVNRLQETLGRLESLKKRREDVALEKDHHHSRRDSGGVVAGRTSSAGNSRSTTPKSYRSGGAADVSVHSDDSWAAAVPNERELSTSAARVPRHLRASEHVHYSSSGLRGMVGSSPSSRRSSPDARSARTLSPQNNRIWR
ncbi:Hypothetical protein, putative [Bodo saltans]|uniref:PDZ domain-containing protein n=1 Tax=Bodo saltans TaxID=75058 RepID=A0A0S4JLK2_BODSA|nr:Hypothetical protein, putative [Bodo saltans]|eukprot:CUG92407.1 Hypothetical protein, putative [Bodo saltans]